MGDNTARSYICVYIYIRYISFTFNWCICCSCSSANCRSCAWYCCRRICCWSWWCCCSWKKKRGKKKKKQKSNDSKKKITGFRSIDLYYLEYLLLQHVAVKGGWIRGAGVITARCQGGRSSANSADQVSRSGHRGAWCVPGHLCVPTYTHRSIYVCVRPRVLCTQHP